MATEHGLRADDQIETISSQLAEWPAATEASTPLKRREREGGRREE